MNKEAISDMIALGKYSQIKKSHVSRSVPISRYRYKYKSLRKKDIAHSLLMDKYWREQLQKVESVIRRECKSHEKKVCATWEADRKCGHLAGIDLMDFDDEGASTNAGSSTMDWETSGRGYVVSLATTSVAKRSCDPI